MTNLDKIVDKLFHRHEWEEYRQDELTGYPKGGGPAWREPMTTYWVSHCRCKTCGEPRSFKLNP